MQEDAGSSSEKAAGTEWAARHAWTAVARAGRSWPAAEDMCVDLAMDQRRGSRRGKRKFGAVNMDSFLGLRGPAGLSVCRRCPRGLGSGRNLRAGAGFLSRGGQRASDLGAGTGSLARSRNRSLPERAALEPEAGRGGRDFRRAPDAHWPGRPRADPEAPVCRSGRRSLARGSAPCGHHGGGGEVRVRV